MDSPPRIGVCLSGGGFRASFYALGVLRYLAEAGLLRTTVGISAVSGGSIAAAMFADRAGDVAAAGWTGTAFVSSVDSPFREVATERNLRNEWIAKTLEARIKFQKGGRSVVLGNLLEDRLFRTERVCDLPPGPQVILTTTDMGAGRAFRVSRDFVGGYDVGYVEPTPPGIRLGQVTAASAAVPGLIPPVPIPVAGFGLKTSRSTLFLGDGGVYDNLGLEWFQGWVAGRPPSAQHPDFMIVANASGLLKETDRGYGGITSLLRARDVQYSQTTRLRVRWFARDLLAERVRGTYQAIERDPRKYVWPDGTPVDPSAYDGALPSQLVAPLARLRTDLNIFSREEADLLSYHAYWSLHARLAALHPEIAIPRPAWRAYAKIDEAEQALIVARLEQGSRRF